jgi:hypothetical protein
MPNANTSIKPPSPHEEGCTCEWCIGPEIKKQIKAQVAVGFNLYKGETHPHDIQDRHKQYRKEQEATEKIFAQDA